MPLPPDGVTGLYLLIVYLLNILLFATAVNVALILKDVYWSITRPNRRWHRHV